MAPGRQFQCIAHPADLLEVLNELAVPLYGVVTTFPPSTALFEWDIKKYDDFCNQSKVLMLLLLRTQRLSSQLSLSEYDRAMIDEGFVQIEVPNIYMGSYRPLTMLVGTQPPVNGIDSPLKLFNSIKRLLSNRCKLPRPSGLKQVNESSKASEWGLAMLATEPL
jgi:hypothetical protein